MPTSLPTPTWAAQVAAATPLPDARLNSRLERMLGHLADKPVDAFPQALPDFHQAKASYRFLANERIDHADLLTGWRKTTTQALRSQPLVYVAHDTTTFVYNTLKQTSGLGSVNHIEAVRGLHCHTSLALATNGVVLGLLHQHYWTRSGTRATRPQDRDLSDKESIKWLHGLEATNAACLTLPAAERPRIVHLMDREGDIHEVFVRVQSLGHGAIIRRYRNRNFAEAPGDADEAIRRAPVLARLRLQLPAGHGRRARTAVVALRSRRLTLTPNSHHERHRQPLSLTMVEVREVDAPPRVEEPLHWLLWTNEPARSKKQVLAVTRAYLRRWRIEDFHLTWKQGCRVERLQLATAERLIKALVLYAGVAVRLLRLRDLARREPTAPCTEVLTSDEWQALYAQATGERPTPQTPIPTLEQATKWIGRLGGHLGRKRDGMPGVRTLWRGWRDLAILVAGFRAGRQHPN
jgi:Transposase Tn5 dimerisation domain/Transposase DNA-binding